MNAVAEQTPESVLLPYQQKWVEDRSQVKICEKSRRIGLSWCDGSDSVLTAAAHKAEGGMDVWYIGYNKDMAMEYIRDCGFWAKHFNIAAGQMEEEILKDEDKDILTYVIHFASGFRITALSSRPSNLRGKQGKVILDEAAFHDDLAGLIKAAVALLIWGGRVEIISTHDGDANKFNELIQDTLAGKLNYSHHRITFKQALKEGLFRRICLVTKQQWTQEKEDKWVAEMYRTYGEDAAEELDVIPSSGSGTYLTRAMIEGVMREGLPVLRYDMPDYFKYEAAHIREAETKDWCGENILPLLKELNPNLRHYFGSDFARSGDVSAICPLQQQSNLDLLSPFVIEMRNIPFEQQKQILFYTVDRLPRFVAGAMDARGNGQYMAEVAAQKYGSSRIAEVMLSQSWYMEHMPRFKAHFEDQTIVIPKNADIMADLRLIKKDKGVAKVPDGAKTRGTDGKDRHGDTAVGFILGTYAAAEMEGGEFDYIAASHCAERWDGPDDDDHWQGSSLTDDLPDYEAGGW